MEHKNKEIPCIFELGAEYRLHSLFVYQHVLLSPWKDDFWPLNFLTPVINVPEQGPRKKILLALASRG